MKKITTLLFAVILGINFSSAQTMGGPDAYGYIWRNSSDAAGPVYNWIDVPALTGAQKVRFLADDNTKGSFPIGFNFHFYWYDVSQFWVGSNGYVGFTGGQISHPFPMIPSTVLPQDYLAVMESDLIFDSANPAECWRWTNAAADTCIISFITVPFWDPSPPGWVGSNTFQVILSAIDSSITYQYKEQTGSPALTTNFVSIGIENNSGNIGLPHSYNILPPINYAVKYYYPSATTYMVSDASTIYNDNTETGGIFRSQNGAQFTMNTSVKNTGNQNLAPYNVYSRVLDGGGVVQASDNKFTIASVPAQTENITMLNKFNPTTAGTFTYVTNTQLTGDATPSNDQKIQELVVLDTTPATIRLAFDDGIEAGLGGLNWTGGAGGAAVYFIPPYYPCKITQTHAYIAANPGFVGYSMQLFDDNGIGGAAGTRLDSEYVASGVIVTPAWNTNVLPTPITINSGGVYLGWFMEGANITLGQNQNPPFSNRTFEVVGGAWADYRYRVTEDLMINMSITPASGAGIEESALTGNFGDFYPNPAAYSAAIDYNFNSPIQNLSYEIYDMQGKLIGSKTIAQSFTNGKLIVNTESFNNGMYSCRIIADGKSIAKKFVVLR